MTPLFSTVHEIVLLAEMLLLQVSEEERTALLKPVLTLDEIPKKVSLGAVSRRV
jgi:hypothetical protein